MPRNSFSRRALLQAGSCAIAADLTGEAKAAQSSRSAPASPKDLPALNRFPRMVQEYFVERIRALPRPEPSTREEAEAYVRDVRSKVRRCFGPEPARTPLNARVTGAVDRDAYRIEKLIFESRPGFLVTGNLYVPKTGGGGLPAVVGVCGHADEGKAYPEYQSYAQGLARLGYAVLIIDPLGQGERLQYVTPDLKPRWGTGVPEHVIAGNQQLLIGEFLGMWRAWDAIRALDYLSARPEVDPKRIGVTGHSGGGTITTWLCALDERWAAAAPCCFVTTLRRNLENELPQDTEQCPPQALEFGLEHEDFIAAMAPRPVILLPVEGDFFDIRGTVEAYGRLKNLYARLGAPDNIQLAIAPGGHAYSKPSREAMYRFFGKALGGPQPASEPALTIEKPETLWCTPKGQVAALGSRNVFAFTRERAAELAKTAPAGSLEERIASLLKLPARKGVPDFRILRPEQGRGYPKPRFSVYAVETEPRIHAVVYRLDDQAVEAQPPKTDRPAILYVSHQSADRELRSEPLIRELIAAEPGSVLYTCDVRGAGESQPDTCGLNSFLEPYGSDFFYAMYASMFGEPYPGRRTHDILSVLDWLASYGHEGVHLAALGWGTVPATYAAVLSPHVGRVTLKGALDSFASIAQSESYTWPVSSFVPGAVGKADLPECYRALAAKKLRRLQAMPRRSARSAPGRARA